MVNVVKLSNLDGCPVIIKFPAWQVLEGKLEMKVEPRIHVSFPSTHILPRKLSIKNVTPDSTSEIRILIEDGSGSPEYGYAREVFLSPGKEITTEHPVTIM